MINTRMTQTITATKMGTTLIKVEVLITAELPSEWLVIAMVTPHQVSAAFAVPARSHAPNKYQASLFSR